MTSTKPEIISPLGSTVEEAAARRSARSAVYREQHDRLAPYRAIADAVILARGARKMTQRDLGDILGTTDTAISRIESGRHPVTLDTLNKLGTALGLTFLVGSANAAENAKCVVVPEAAIEPKAPSVAVAPHRSAPTYTPMPVPAMAYALSAPTGGRKSR
jgi:transcriptional regulator with XRE-family HTH domain